MEQSNFDLAKEYLRIATGPTTALIGIGHAILALIDHQAKVAMPEPAKEINLKQLTRFLTAKP